MFLDVTFHSLNSRADLPAGSYRSVCRLYRGPAGLERALLFEYRLQPEDTLRACDLLLIDEDGSMRARDFVLTKDFDWRDSAGMKAGNLISLIPQEISNFRFEREQELPTELVEAQFHGR